MSSDGALAIDKKTLEHAIEKSLLEGRTLDTRTLVEIARSIGLKVSLK